MKPVFEDIHPSFGSSFTFRQFTGRPSSDLPYWHFHPEYELIFISNGKGRRQIGGHISTYEDGDLVLLGPNLPHLGFTQEAYEEHVEYVIQMKENFLGVDFFEQPEMTEIRKLFERARTGLTFKGHTKWVVGERLHKMEESDTFSKMLELLMILQILAYSEDCTPLNINYLSVEVKQQDHERLNEVYAFVEKNFKSRITLEDVASVANMTVPAFCRFFKKLTHRTFIDFLNEFRVRYACRLLSEKSMSIAAASYESGFNNLSHFNKQFRIITGQTPSGYRKSLKRYVQTPLPDSDDK